MRAHQVGHPAAGRRDPGRRRSRVWPRPQAGMMVSGMILSVFGCGRVSLKLAPVAAVLALAPAAQAVPTASFDGSTVTVVAPPGEVNQIHPKLFPCPQCAPSGALYLLQDKSFLSTPPNMIAGPGCTSETSGNGGAVCGDPASIRVLRLDLNDGDDRANRPDAPSPSVFLPIGADYHGGPGDDRLRGGDRADRLDGGTGNDVLIGEGGDDVIVGGPGVDLLSGGDGNDLLLAADGTRDVVACGAGRDRAVVDRKDFVTRSCERVRVVR